MFGREKNKKRGKKNRKNLYSQSSERSVYGRATPQIQNGAIETLIDATLKSEMTDIYEV